MPASQRLPWSWPLGRRSASRRLLILPPPRTPSVWPRVVQLGLVLSLLFGFAVLWHVANAGRERVMAADKVRATEIGNRRALDMLVRTGSFFATPDPAVFEPARSPTPHHGILEFTTRPQPDIELPSTRLARATLGDEAVAYDVLSLAIDPEDWDDPVHGIYTHPFERGRDWQRGACLSLFTAGRLVAESTVGLRIHGGRSRRKHEKSLRLALTPAYGATVTTADLLPGAIGESLVVHNDRRALRYANPIAYRLAALVGCEVPRTRPLRLLINGELLDYTYFLTEHLDDSHFSDKLGHRKFSRVDERVRPKPRRYYSHYIRPLRRQPALMRDAEQHVDVGAAIDWLTAILFCAPYDSRQGIAWLDHLGDARWRWVVWDMDWSFQPWPETVIGERIVPRSVTADLMQPHEDIRTGLFSKLMADDPAFRRRLLARVSRALNHELTQPRLDAVLADYDAIARLYGGKGRANDLAAVETIAAFVAARPERLRDELRAQFDLGRVRTCAVRVPAGQSVTIDGYAYDTDWSGRYFEGQLIRVRRVDGGRGFAVDGQQRPGTELRLAVEGDVEIRVLPD